jgi:hypothetical protein
MIIVISILMNVEHAKTENVFFQDLLALLFVVVKLIVVFGKNVEVSMMVVKLGIIAEHVLLQKYVLLDIAWILLALLIVLVLQLHV